MTKAIRRTESSRKKRPNTKWGGVIIYVADSVRYKRRLDLEDPRIETIWVEINLKIHNLLVCCFNRSAFVVNPSNVIVCIQLSIEEALDYTNHVILVGDINTICF